MHIEILHVFDHNFIFTLVLFVVFYCIVDRTLGVGPSESPADSYRTGFESQCTDRHPRGHRSSSPKSGGSTNQQVMYTINQSIKQTINVSNVVLVHKASLFKVSRIGAFCCLMYMTVYMITIYMYDRYCTLSVFYSEVLLKSIYK